LLQEPGYLNRGYRMAELVWKGKQGSYPPGGSDITTTGGSSVSYHLVTDQLYPSTTQSIEEPYPSPVWQNRLIRGDRCQALSLLVAELAGKVDLIYIDPPFMTGRIFGNGEHIAYRDIWDEGLDSYLQWLYETLTLLHVLLASDGSLYVHLDWRATHYAKIVLDEIFGATSQAQGAGFKNEIIWHYQSGGRARRYYARKHDTLLLYTKSAHYCFHSERVSPRRGASRRNHMRREVGPDGRITWTIRAGGRVYSYDEDTAMLLPDVWSDISHLHQKDPERIGYATQKPEALLERVLLASSEEHDLVLDCFCGSGVVPAVAERLGRRWIVCDNSDVAASMTKDRLLARDRTYPFVLQHVEEGPAKGTIGDARTTL
jgi:site-specific DNA-methyltransferase (adenine-specific)